jgi:hypothetical protein
VFDILLPSRRIENTAACENEGLFGSAGNLLKIQCQIYPYCMEVDSPEAMFSSHKPLEICDFTEKPTHCRIILSAQKINFEFTAN